MMINVALDFFALQFIESCLLCLPLRIKDNIEVVMLFVVNLLQTNT